MSLGRIEEKHDHVKIGESELFSGLLKPKNETATKEPPKKSEARVEFEKTEKNKKYIDIMLRASRFTNISTNNNKKQNLLEKTIISKVSNIKNFDYLSLRQTHNKLYKRVTNFLEREKENKYSLFIFSDYMYKIDKALSKKKRILIVTENYVY